MSIPIEMFEGVKEEKEVSRPGRLILTSENIKVIDRHNFRHPPIKDIKEVLRGMSSMMEETQRKMHENWKKSYRGITESNKQSERVDVVGRID
jgi:hypothetical protein